MNSEQISQTVSRWVQDESNRGPVLPAPGKKNPWYGMSEEEVEDRREFIRCYLNKDFEVLLQIPIEPREDDFWSPSHQEFRESAFNTWDFQKDQKPFNKYGYRIKKVVEQVRDLAIYHSSTSQPEGKANIQRKYENLVDNEFRGRLLILAERYQRAAGEEERYLLRRKIAELNRRILQCQKIWEKYARWE